MDIDENQSKSNFIYNLETRIFIQLVFFIESIYNKLL